MLCVFEEVFAKSATPPQPVLVGKREGKDASLCGTT